jgi:hypothetical protein
MNIIEESTNQPKVIVTESKPKKSSLLKVKNEPIEVESPIEIEVVKTKTS